MPRAAGTAAIGLGVFGLSFAIRCLYAVDLAPVMYTRDQPGTRMAMRYDAAALRMLAGDGLLYPREIDPARTGLLARPPGYPAFLRVVYATLGRSFFTVQLVQNVLNSVTPVLILFLRAAPLRARRSGSSAACSPPCLPISPTPPTSSLPTRSRRFPWPWRLSSWPARPLRAGRPGVAPRWRACSWASRHGCGRT